MWIALLLLTSMADWVPARWNTAEPKSLEIVSETPVNCLLLEEKNWQPVFVKAAAEKNIVTLGIVHPSSEALETARRAISAGLKGVVLEGDFEPDLAARIRSFAQDMKAAVIEMGLRYRMPLDSSIPVVGTVQGVWPGIQLETEGSTKAAPSGAPWINTNTGFLRFARAATSSTIWVGVTPPSGSNWRVERYLQAIGDAAMSGARWVVALDSDFESRLLAREARALKDWQRIGTHLKFFEDHKEWRSLQPHGLLAIVQDTSSGALLSGGILDMIAVKHTPVRPIPTRILKADLMQGAQMAVNVDPESLTQQQRDALRAFTRSGGTLLSGPPGWKFPSLKEGQITLPDEEVKTLDNIWKDLNSMTGRRNLGARLFNVSSMLSNLLSTPDGKQLILHLVNYSDYPVESITVHVLGNYKRARLLTPEGVQKDLEVYPVEEGTGIDIDQLSVIGTLQID
jgi:hypothetical protein